MSHFLIADVEGPKVSYIRRARAETESDHVSIAPESYLKLPICLVGLGVNWVPWRRYE